MLPVLCEWCTRSVHQWMVPLSVHVNTVLCSVNSPCSFPQSQMFEQNTWEQGWVLCYGPWSLSASAEAACAPNVVFVSTHSWCHWLVFAPVKPPRFRSQGGQVLPRRKPGKTPDSATKRFCSFCLSLSLKEQLVSPCLTPNVRQTICETDGSRL